MDLPQDNPRVSAQHGEDVQDMLNRLKDATSNLQRVTAERVAVRMEVQQWREEMDRRVLLLLHADAQVCEALMELEAAKQEKQSLIQMIQSLNAHTRGMKLSNASASMMQKPVEEALEEEENKLKQQCEHDSLEKNVQKV